jgi:hypothetical protein
MKILLDISRSLALNLKYFKLLQIVECLTGRRTSQYHTPELKLVWILQAENLTSFQTKQQKERFA